MAGANQQRQPADQPRPEPATTSVDRRRYFDKVTSTELALVAPVLLAALFLRLWRLGSVPEIVTADEANNLQSAYQIIEGTGPGWFGFDWKPMPAFSMHTLAWTIRIFGDSLTAARMFPVLLSMMTLVGVHLVLRRIVRPVASALALGLLGSNLSFLHFSRTAWENLNASLCAVCACWCIQNAVDVREGRDADVWWGGAGVATALGLYGYFAGWFIGVAVVTGALFALTARHISFTMAVRGVAIAGVVAAVLYAPMARVVLTNWEFFTQRTSTVSIFGLADGFDYLGDTDSWTIARKNFVRNYEGFILHDGSEFSRGLWGRYNPAGEAPLGFVSKHLLWAGMLTSLVMFRRTWAWWPFFVPLFITQVFSLGTPDLARGVFIVPFYFLYIGVLFNELLRAVAGRARTALIVMLALGVLAISYAHVDRYFDWQQEVPTQFLRMPGFAACEFELWSDGARSAAEVGATIDGFQFDVDRRVLACSDLVNEYLNPGG